MNSKARYAIKVIIPLLFIFSFAIKSYACSIVYYVDSTTGKIFIANNEDYWYDTKSYIQIMPARKNKHARLWYGWDHFAQGGINSAGLFFDGAVTPKQSIPAGYKNPKGRNVGDEILAYCKNVMEAIAYLEKEKIAISTGHMFLGDATGHAVVLEWVNGEKNIISIESNVLIATNYLLSDTSAGNYPCFRYQSIQDRVTKLKESTDTIDLRKFGNVIAGAVQPPRKDPNGKEGGTLYTSVIDLTDMELVLVPKLNNSRALKINLTKEFKKSRKKKIKL